MDMKPHIEELAIHNACARRALAMKETGHCTYQEALEYLVLAFAESNRTLQDLVIRQAQEMPPQERMRLSTDGGYVPLGAPA